MVWYCDIIPHRKLKFFFTLEAYYKLRFRCIVFWRERTRMKFSRVTRCWEENMHRRQPAMQSEVRKKGTEGKCKQFVPPQTDRKIKQTVRTNLIWTPIITQRPTAPEWTLNERKGNFKMVGKLCGISTCPHPTLSSA